MAGGSCWNAGRAAGSRLIRSLASRSQVVPARLLWCVPDGSTARNSLGLGGSLNNRIDPLPTWPSFFAETITFSQRLK
jgi:hypothetical protein